MANSKKAPQYIGFGLIAIVILLSYFLLKSYLITLLNAVIVTLIFYPIYNWLNKKTKRKYLSSSLTSLAFIIIITIPLLIVLNSLGDEAGDAYSYIKEKIKNWEDSTEEEKSGWLISRILDFVDKYNLQSSIENTIGNLSKSIYTGTFTFILKIPQKIAGFLIMLFVMFFLFIEGNTVIKHIKKTIPIKTKNKNKIIKKMNNMVYGVVYGQIVIAIVQGVLGGLGFYIFGLPNPVLWGMVMAFFAILPFIGASFIWAPGAIYLIVSGIIDSTGIMILKGILLIIYGLLLIGSIETFAKPKIIGKWTKTHPVVILLGILGGLQVFGLMGIIIGPTILSMAMLLFESYVKKM